MRASTLIVDTSCSYCNGTRERHNFVLAFRDPDGIVLELSVRTRPFCGEPVSPNLNEKPAWRAYCNRGLGDTSDQMKRKAEFTVS